MCKVEAAQSVWCKHPNTRTSVAVAGLVRMARPGQGWVPGLRSEEGFLASHARMMSQKKEGGAFVLTACGDVCEMETCNNNERERERVYVFGLVELVVWPQPNERPTHVLDSQRCRERLAPPALVVTTGAAQSTPHQGP